MSTVQHVFLSLYPYVVVPCVVVMRRNADSGVEHLVHVMVLPMHRRMHACCAPPVHTSHA
jgi:hypothetical protein